MSQDLLKASEFQNIFLDYSDNPEILEDYKSFHQQETVPIILSNHLVSGLTKKIGGYTEFADWCSVPDNGSI